MEASISFCRAMRACHQSACSFFAASGHLASASRGISHSCHCFLSAAFSVSRSGSSVACHLLPDDVDLGVVGDGLQRDVRHALVDEAVADVAVHRLRTRRGAGDFGFLELAVAGIGEQVERIARAHDAGAGQRQRDARGVDRDPAAAPLLGDGGGGAGAAGWVEHEVAGVGGHQEAAFDNLRDWFGRRRPFVVTNPLIAVSVQMIGERNDGKVVEETERTQACLPRRCKSISLDKPVHAHLESFSSRPCARREYLPSNSN